MDKELKILWLNEKEVQIYMYLSEYGISAASEISNKLKIPKSTVNFISDNLWEKWILKKSFRSKTGYYEADPIVFESKITWEISEKNGALEKIMPLLKENSKNILSKPKTFFLDWLESCKNAYLEILHCKEKKFYEFWAHHDLEKAFWKIFMADFIEARVIKNIRCEAIWTSGHEMNSLRKHDETQLRSLEIFSNTIWNISSSICIFDNKVLILNLRDSYKWICIENPDLAETMKTIFKITKI